MDEDIVFAILGCAVVGSTFAACIYVMTTIC